MYKDTQDVFALTVIESLPPLPTTKNEMAIPTKYAVKLSPGKKKKRKLLVSKFCCNRTGIPFNSGNFKHQLGTKQVNVVTATQSPSVYRLKHLTLFLLRAIYYPEEIAALHTTSQYHNESGKGNKITQCLAEASAIYPFYIKTKNRNPF